MRKLKPLFWALYCAGLSATAWAGLSPLRVLSQAGQPFEAELSIVDEPLPDSAHVELADPNRYGVLAPYSASAGNLRFSLLKKPDSGQYVVKVQGPAHFDESELRFAVEVSWADGRVVREYRVNPLQGVPPLPPTREDQPAKKAVPSAKPGLAMPAMLLGDIKLHSRIGEPLHAEVEVHGQGLHQGELSARLEQGAAAQAEPIQVEVVSRDVKRAVLSLSSQSSIDEPVLRFRLLVSHGEEQVSKAYTLLLNPEQQAAEERAAKYGHVADAQAELTAPNLHYRVRRGDTLYAISRQLVEGDRSIETVMRRLVRSNPAAFVRANPDRMRSEALLSYPAAWGKVKVSRHVASVHRAAPKPKLEHKAMARPIPTTPTVSPPSASVNARRIELEHKLQQQDKQLQQLEGKARQLEQQLKAQALLKAQAQKAREAQKTQEAQKALEAQKAREAQKTQEQQKAPAPPVKLVELPPEPHPHDYSQEVRAGAAAGLLLTGLGGMAWLYHRRRQHQAEQGLLPPQDLMADQPPPEPTDSGPASVTLEVSPKAQRDWLGQAEALQANGLYDQAIEILRAGIAASPNRQELHFKLLQLLGKRQDFAGVLEQAQQSIDRFGIESTLGQRILEWGRIVMPNHPLFAARSAPPAEDIPLTPEMGRASVAKPGDDSKPQAAAPGSLWDQHEKKTRGPSA
jgi:Tfp pilus assembly protein FimV